MSGLRVLVTGASGFVGRPLLTELARKGVEVHAADLAPAITDAAWHRLDLTDQDARRRLMAEVRPTHLVHLAWYVAHGKFWTAPENETWRDLSIGLFDEFVRGGGRRAVFIGSCAEYDWSRTDLAPWREDDPCAPATPYGTAKHALHQSVSKAATENGVSLAWARLFLLFGEGEDRRRLVPALIDALSADRTLELSSGNQVRDFSDTRDVAAALAALLFAEAVTGAVNVASGRGTSIRELAGLLAKLMSTTCDRLRFGALADRDEPPSMVADVTRLVREVGYAGPPPLSERLSHYIR